MPSSGCMITLYQKYRAIYWLRRIDSYFFVMILSSVTNIFAHYLLKTMFFEEIVKAGPEYTDESVASSGWLITLYQKYRADSWLRGINLYLFVMIMSFSTNIFAYYLLKTTFFIGNNENRPQSTLMNLFLHQDRWSPCTKNTEESPGWEKLILTFL